MLNPASRRPAYRPWLAACLLVLGFLFAVLPAQAQQKEPDYPALTGRVVDDANLLDASQEADLTAKLKSLEDETSDQLVVVTLPSLEGYPIETYGYQLGRHWGIGTAKLNNGVLLIVAPKERKVRIEVGYGLEGKLTDLLSHLIVENAILPQFRNGDYPAGIEAGVRDITLTLTGHGEEVQQRALSEHRDDDDEVDWITIIIWIAIILYVVYVFSYGPGPGAGRGGRGSGWGGSSGGGFGGGGGFSGGGGSFGGGGASGSW